MARSRNPQQHARLLGKRFAFLEVEMRVSHKELVDKQVANMVELTSGTTSTATLRRKGYPFATRTRMKRKKGGRFGTVPLLPINKQKGRLARSRKRVTRYDGPKGRVDDLFFLPGIAGKRLWVVSPGGTRRMRARGFWREMKKRYRKDALMNRREFQSKAAAIKRIT